MKITGKSTALLLGVVGLALIAYVTFFNEPEQTLDVSVIGVTPESSVGGELIVLLDKLRAIQLDNKLFSSNTFLSLLNYRREIIEEPIGRSNPFAPIGKDALVGSTQ